MKSTAALPGSTCGQRCVSSPSWSVVNGWARRRRPARATVRKYSTRRRRCAILAPAATARVARVGNFDRRPPLHRHLLQFATRKERNPLSVGRKKWLVCAFSALQERAVWLIDAPRRERRATGAANRDNDARAVRRKRKRPSALVGSSPPKSRSNLTSGRASGCGVGSANDNPSAAAITPAAAQGIHVLLVGAAFASSRSSPIMNCASPIARSRRLNLFLRQRVNRRSAGCGTRVQSGSFVRTAATVSDTVSFPKHKRPVSISDKNSPECPNVASLVDGLSTGLLGRHGTRWSRGSVQARWHRRGSASSSRRRRDPKAFARPKSSTLTVPSV